MSAKQNGVDVLADLRGVVRIAKAASIGVTGNGPRIERAEQAIAAFAGLIEAMGRILQADDDQSLEQEDIEHARAALRRAGGGE